MKPFKLTVLTEPIHDASTGISVQLKTFLRPVKYLLQGKVMPAEKTYGGHYAVTRSLIEGLKKLNVDFNYNPVNDSDIAENVIVLADVEALQKAIQLKNKGRIKKLFAGPNVCVSPNEENGLLAEPAIDSCIVPSEWVASFYLQQKKELQGRIEIWHAGVDTDYWQSSSNKQEEAIVYWKTEDEKFCEAVENIVRENNYKPIRIKYGSYSPEKYKEALDIAEFAVFISRSESQGIALAEAWAMNVPTYVWDTGKFIYKEKKYSATACPYLTSETGMRWIHLNELKAIIEKKRKAVYRFEPRKNILKSFSDKQCASDLVNKFH